MKLAVHGLGKSISPRQFAPKKPNIQVRLFVAVKQLQTSENMHDGQCRDEWWVYSALKILPVKLCFVADVKFSRRLYPTVQFNSFNSALVLTSETNSRSKFAAFAN